MPAPDHRLDIVGEKYLGSWPVPRHNAGGRYEIADDDVEGFLVEQRVQDKQRRADLIRDRLSTLSIGQIGVWLILCEGAWSQS